MSDNRDLQGEDSRENEFARARCHSDFAIDKFAVTKTRVIVFCMYITLKAITENPYCDITFCGAR